MIFFTRTLFIVITACLSLPGCALVLCLIDTDVSHTPRFKNVAGHELPARKKLYLYEPDNNGSDKVRLLYVLESTYTSHPKPIAILPAGHPVRIHKVMRQHEIGDYSDYLYGEVTIKGTTYPLKHLVGLYISPEGRDEMHEMFVVRD